ncbi:hypothetical protein ACFL54_09725, partial [Planctomycetota bacterium]
PKCLLQVLQDSPNFLRKLLHQMAYRTKELNKQIEIEHKTTKNPGLVTNYFKGLVALMQMILLKNEDSDLKGLYEYIIKTNPTQIKEGSIHHLDRNIIKECGLDHVI